MSQLNLFSFNRGTKSLYFGIKSGENIYSIIYDCEKSIFYCDCEFETNKLKSLLNGEVYTRCKHIRTSLVILRNLESDIE